MHDSSADEVGSSRGAQIDLIVHAMTAIRIKGNDQSSRCVLEPRRRRLGAALRPIARKRECRSGSTSPASKPGPCACTGRIRALRCRRRASCRSCDPPYAAVSKQPLAQKSTAYRRASRRGSPLSFSMGSLPKMVISPQCTSRRELRRAGRSERSGQPFV